MTKMGKNHTDVGYSINEGSEDDDDDDDDDESVDAPDAPEGDEELARELQEGRAGGKRSSSRLAMHAAAQSDAAEGAAERERRQIDLMKRRNEERIRQLAKENRKKGGEDEKDQVEELETYKRTSDYPENVQPNQVKVDMSRECVILPICGNPVPFHISTIKNIVMPDDDTATLLRINFYTAGMAIGKDAPANMAKLVAKYAPYASFIREMTFRSLEGHNLTLVSDSSRWTTQRFCLSFLAARPHTMASLASRAGFPSDLRTPKASPSKRNSEGRGSHPRCTGEAGSYEE